MTEAKYHTSVAQGMLEVTVFDNPRDATRPIFLFECETPTDSYVGFYNRQDLRNFLYVSKQSSSDFVEVPLDKIEVVTEVKLLQRIINDSVKLWPRADKATPHKPKFAPPDIVDNSPKCYVSSYADDMKKRKQQEAEEDEARRHRRRNREIADRDRIDC